MTNEPSTIRIGGRSVGPGQPACLIAEAGVNHNGSVDQALRLVDAARDAGVQAVKFQAFKAARLAGRHAAQAAYQKGSAPAGSQVEMLARLELSPADFTRIQRHCDAAGVEFLATPFGVEDLRVLLDLNVKAIKIASPDLINRPLLEAAAASGLPILLSTGASEPSEIDAAFELLTHPADRAPRPCYQSAWHGHPGHERYRPGHSGTGFEPACPLVLLHCVSSYPTRLEHANLGRIRTLRERYRCPVGYSDHTAETFTGQLAVAAGACVLEKHFTLDRAQPGPDHAFSLAPAELAEYVRLIRQAEAALGSGRIELSAVEREVRQVSRCSLTTVRDLQCGAVLTRDVLAVKRPGTGISPWDIEAVIGRTIRCDVPADTPVTWEMLGDGS